MSAQKMIRVVAPTFVCGLELGERIVGLGAAVDETAMVVIDAAPILSYMLRWTEAEVLRYVEARGWEATEIFVGMVRLPDA